MELYCGINFIISRGYYFNVVRENNILLTYYSMGELLYEGVLCLVIFTSVDTEDTWILVGLL